MVSGEGGLTVEGEDTVGRHAVFEVVPFGGEETGDREAVAPSVGEKGCGREAEAACGGVAKEQYVWVGSTA